MEGQRSNPLPEKMDAVIISLDEDTEEMKELARAMNYQIRTVFVQNRDSPHPKFFLGKGKVAEIGTYLKGSSVKMAVVNSPLKPTQIFHLQNAWDVTVFDRTRLILEIFSNRARSQEARLQVELAKLEYEVPLVKELIHRSKMGEHPGYMAGGEYQVDQYYEMIRKRIKKIRSRLKTVKKDRSEKRRRRREKGFFLISIAGYTNAGKSMLLKALTSEDVIIEDKVFSTLVTLTRRGRGRRGEAFLFSDTVGFIKDLPPWLIEAFHSTLEEIFLADIVLLVIDVSEGADIILNKIRTSYGFLRYKDEVPPIIIVFNKMDLLEKRVDGTVLDVLERMKEEGLPYLDEHIISAIKGTNIDSLLDGMISSLQKLDYAERLTIDIDEKVNSERGGEVKKFINWLYDNYVVVSNDSKGHRISLVILCKKPDVEIIMARAIKLNVVLEP
jgi:GTP-binding protein HflX